MASAMPVNLDFHPNSPKSLPHGLRLSPDILITCQYLQLDPLEGLNITRFRTEVSKPAELAPDVSWPQGPLPL